MFRIQRSILVYGMGPVGKPKQVDSVGKLWNCPSFGILEENRWTLQKSEIQEHVPLTEKNLYTESV
jgi:hypothetical protein